MPCLRMLAHAGIAHRGVAAPGIGKINHYVCKRHPAAGPRCSHHVHPVPQIQYRAITRGNNRGCSSHVAKVVRAMRVSLLPQAASTFK
eukprot:1151015-Pelagomonas_calceolata.AAC.5